MGFTLRFLLGSLLVLSSLLSLQRCAETEKTTKSPQLLNDSGEQTQQEINKNFGDKIIKTNIGNTPKTDDVSTDKINLDNNNNKKYEEINNKIIQESTQEPNSTKVKLKKSEPYVKKLIPQPSEESESSVKKNNIEKLNESRRNNGRSIDVDINKYTSPEFHNRNNVYTLDTSEDIKKYVNADETEYHMSTTYKSQETKFDVELTTPKSILFDEKYKKTVENIDQTLLDHIDFDLTKTDQKFTESNEETADLLDKYIEQTKEVVNDTKATLDYTNFKNIIKNDTLNKNSAHKDLIVEEGTNLNFNSSYNDTKIIDEQNHVLPKLFEVTTTKNNPTTKKSSVTLTKPPSNRNQSHILSNKIETETIKSVHGTTENPSTKNVVNRGSVRFKAVNQATTLSYFPKGNELSKLDQVVQENQIIPIHVVGTTESSLESNGTTVEPEEGTTSQINEITTTTEDIPETTTNSIQLPEKTTTIVTTTTTMMDNLTIETTTGGNEEITTQNFEITTEMVPVETTTNDIGTTTTILEDITTQEPPGTTTTTTTTTAKLDELNKTTITTTTTQSDKSNIIIEKTTESDTRTSKGLNFTNVVQMMTTPLNLDITTTEMFLETTTEASKENLIEITTVVPEINLTTTTEPVETTTTINNLEDLTTITVVPEVSLDTTISSTSTTSTTTSTTTEASDYEVTDYSVDEQPLNKNSPVVKSTTEIVFVHIDDVFNNNNSRIVPDVFKPQTTTTESSGSDETTTSGGTTKNEELNDPSDNNNGTIIAIVISCVGGVCLVVLTGLLIIMRKRQKRFNYGQRCTPVGLDDYSVDNTSVYNSVRRKGAMRASKRSYGNPAFDDPVSVSHPLNFPAISKFSNNLEDMKAEYEDIPQITARTTELPEGCDTKNRYANVIPLPETRVFLSSIEGYPNSDYINANYVTGPKNTKNYYIACQAPLQNTVDDFWRMIWEQQCKVVLMLTHLFENGVEKCIDYLPPSEVLDCHRLFGDFQVTLKKREVKDKYVISNLQLKNMVSNSWREVTHFWYLGWPEKGVPTETNSLIAYLIEARSYMKSATIDKKLGSSNGNLSNGTNELNPVVVHCSPGTGRTGTVIACDIAIREFEMTRLVDIPRIVYRIRRDRASSVQTKEQYAFIYKVINLYATKLTGGALDSI